MSSTQSLPLLLPAVYALAAGQVAQADVDTGGYDISIGGNGFRLATDQQNPYTRVTEPTTVRRFDDSNEPGEQSLSPLPWIKSQNSFHGGAGQRNLEQGFTAFQYEQEQVSHVRFDTCLGVDVWTPGVVKRLPATRVTATNLSTTCFAAANSPLAPGNGDYIVAGGADSLYVVSWPTGPDGPASIVNLTTPVHTHYGGGAFTVESIASDGSSWYALVHFTSDLTGASAAGVRTFVMSAEYCDPSAGGALLYKAAADSTQHHGVLGWAKARLVAGLDRSLYELDPGVASPPAVLPAAKYTHYSKKWTWTAISESPSSVLGAGVSGATPDILAFELDTSGAAPTLAGGASVGQVPAGERINSMVSVLGTFIALGTTKGVRVGTFDTYTGALKLGPLSVETTQPVYGVATRDRFVYGGFSNQQADGTTGLCRIDLSYVVDASGRNAWAPDLRPPTSAPTGLGTVIGVGILPLSARMVWYSTDGFHVEGDLPSADGVAWLQTSRIRYDTAEFKLFKSGRIAGTLSDSSITVTAVTPFGGAANVGTFGFLVDGNPGEFGLPSEICEWIQMRFQLNGSGCQLNSYQVKAYPSPKVQDVITLTVNCYLNESDKSGIDVTDPRTPRERFEALRQLKLAGQEVRYVEYTNQGPVALNVLIDQVAFISQSRPTIDDDFGGLITAKLRVTQ